MESNNLRKYSRLAMRLALSLDDADVDFSAETLEDDTRERFRKLLEALYFSRDFIKTYNVVLVSILAIYTAVHWLHILKRRHTRGRRVRTVEEDTDAKVLPLDLDGRAVEEASSSGSSTIGEPIEQVNREHVNDERKPLLDRRTRYTKGRNRVGRLSTIKSWLMYQPPNLPVIHKVFPSNLTSLVILAFIGLNIFYMFYRMPLEGNILFLFADRVGLVFVANLPFLYLLGAKNQPIHWLTGNSYESINIVHRRLGELLSLTALLHVTGMSLVWYQEFRPKGMTFWDYLAHPLIYFGAFAFVAYEALYLTSLGSFRQRCYEVFLGLHIVLQTLGLIFLFFHFPQTRPYVIASLAIFLADRLIFRLFLKSTTIPTTLEVLPDGETVMVSANWDIPPHRIFQRPLILHGWQATDHVFLSVPSLGGSHTFQAHPFTIYSAAPTPATGSHAWLSFLIRAQDGFSRDLLEYAKSHISVPMRIDGPYGSSHALHTLEDADAAIFVAGGSGIAVAYPLLYSLLCPSRDSSTDAEQGIFTDGVPPSRSRVHLLWVVHSRSHLAWLPQEKIDELVSWGLELHIPSPTAEVGRPDMQAVLKPWVRGSSDSREGRVGVVVSGPDAMTRDVRNLCASEVGKGRDVRVCVEKFGW